MNKQGRPRFNDDLIEQIQKRFPAVTTRRGQQELCYAVQASDILKDVPDLDLLWTYDELGNRTGMRRRILTELGRLGDAETIKGVAIQLCKDYRYKPITLLECVAKVKKHRLAKETDEFLKGSLSLVPCIVLTDYPGTKWGFLHRGKLIEEPVHMRNDATAPIKGEMPEGWKNDLIFLSDNGTTQMGKLAVLTKRLTFNQTVEWVTIVKSTYVALYRTSKVFFIVGLEPGASHAEVTVIGEDVSNPPAKVLELYMDILPNTYNNHLSPAVCLFYDRERIETTIARHKEQQEELNARSHNPLEHFCR